MNRLIQTVLLTLALPLMAAEDDPLLFMASADHFERAFGDDETATHFESTAWLGYDHHKLYLKSELDREAGETHESEHQLLYSRAISPFWDLQMGVRKDFQPSPRQEWAVIGLQGLAPGFVQTEAALFVQDNGDYAARLTGEYELLLSQHLELAPELQLNFYGQQNPTLAQGAGLSDAALSLRLKYQIRREIVPYIGVSWEALTGETADIAQAAGDETTHTKWLLGIHAWF